MEALAKKAHACPYCEESFDTKMELGFHIGKWHRGKPDPTAATTLNKPAAATPVKEVKPQQTQQEELIIEYNLAESKAGLGELCPVLKDKDGNIIDGFHRKGENQNWREETVPWIDTPVKLELARLAVNFNRRKVTPQELTERITFLIKAGVSVEEIAQQTGIGLRTIYKYKPQGLKNPQKVKASLGVSRQKAESCDAPVHQTVNTSDSTEKASPVQPRFQDKINIETEPSTTAIETTQTKEPLEISLEPPRPDSAHVHQCVCPGCGQLIENCPKEA